MATGFMFGSWSFVPRHFIAAAALCLSTQTALALNVSVAGIFPGKALLVIDGGTPRIVAVGQTTAEGVRLLAIDGETATLEFNGRRRIIRMGENVVSQAAGDGPQEVRLTADPRGHYQTQGAINGQSVRFLVDTGATMVSLGAGDADRIGIDWRKGQAGIAQTANGRTRVWKIRLDSVRVGDITLFGVDGMIHENDMPMVLLGMSFLSRTEMSNDGTTMVLKKRY